MARRRIVNDATAHKMPLRNQGHSRRCPFMKYSTSAPAQIAVPEGRSATVAAKAGGALKLFWILKKDGRETVAAVDRLSFTLDAGRVKGDTSLTLQLKAVYPDGVRTKDIPVTVKEEIPDPVFTLKAPAAWDGRETIEVVPQVAEARDGAGVRRSGDVLRRGLLPRVGEPRAHRRVGQSRHCGGIEPGNKIHYHSFGTFVHIRGPFINYKYIRPVQENPDESQQLFLPA